MDVSASILTRAGPASGATLSRADTLAYILPAAGVAAPFFLIQFYFLNFATDVLLVAPGVIGVWIAASRIWDAVSDPLLGHWSDRTRTRLGRRRPFLIGGALAVGATLVLVWSPPQGLAPLALSAWLGVSLLAFMTATTAWSIPHQAWGAELVRAPHLRTRLFGLRQVCSMLGVAAAFGAMQLVVNADSPRETATQLALTAGLAIPLLLLLPPLLLRESPRERAPQRGRPAREILAIVADPGGRRLFGARLAAMIAMGSQGAIAPYLAIYVLERPDLIGIFPVFYIVPSIVSIPLWIGISRRVGRIRTWGGSMLAAVVFYALLFFVRVDGLVEAALLIALVGFASGSAGPIGPSLLADLIDRDEARTRQRRDGIFFAAWEFTEKTAGAIVVMVVAAALQLSGFEPNVAQGASADFAIRCCLSLFPAAMMGIATTLLWRLRNDETWSDLRPGE
jgi:GPH family glycoside/pentoside/hexuronide:cation symporter